MNLCHWWTLSLAQLDKVSDYESEGREFESRRAHHKNLRITGVFRFLGFLEDSLANPFPPRFARANCLYQRKAFYHLIPRSWEGIIPM